MNKTNMCFFFITAKCSPLHRHQRALALHCCPVRDQDDLLEGCSILHSRSGNNQNVCMFYTDIIH